MLDIPPNSTTEDVKLLFLLETASRWIEEILDRPGMSLTTRTEYYRGTGTQKLLLRSRPVWQSGITVNIDENNGNYGFASGGGFTGDNLTFGTDYTLQRDQDDGSSRCGILLRVGGYWPRPAVRQRGLLSPFMGTDMGSVKVVYQGGYTVDNLPSVIRTACDLIIAKLYYTLPLGVELGSESYEERSISLTTPHKGWLLNMVKPMLMLYKNWSF